MTVDQVIKLLTEKKAEFAHATLTSREKKESFDFGVAVGTYSAYEQMLRDINATMEQEAEAEKDK